MHEWDSDQYWNKAIIYFERARQPALDPEVRLLWNCLGLEHLARSVLTAVHRALNADPQGEGSHLLYACGFPHQKQPKTIPAHAVVKRLQRMYDQFQPHAAVCEELFHVRNAELHSGSTRLNEMHESTWLGRFYGAVISLAEILGRSLDELLAPDEAAHALALAAAAVEENKKEVMDRIAGAKKAFDDLPDEERMQKRARMLAALAYRLHAPCPACGSAAALTGFVVSESRPHYDEGLHVERVHAVDSLRCLACNLELRGVAECAAGGVQPRISVQVPTDIDEAHLDEEEMEYDNM